MNTYLKYFLLSSCFYTSTIFSQSPQVISISPDFNVIASNNNPEISATFNVSMDSTSFDEISFSVFAERSGYHSGNISYSDLTKTVSFNSNEQYNAGERVTVILSNKIKSQQGDSLKGFNWVFRIPSGVAPVNFGEAVTYNGGGYYMQVVDINNDSYPDIATSSGVILLNDGSGNFNNSWLIPDIDLFYPLVVNDFNRDGIMDVFFRGIDGLKVGIGDGAGNFNLSTKPFWFYGFGSDDLNGDGYPDIYGISGVTYIPPDSTTLEWSIAINDGFGNFNDTIMYNVDGGGYPTFIITTDIDNDGDNDIVIGSQPEIKPNGAFGLDGMIVGKNHGSGNFNSFELYPTNTYLYISCAFWGYASDFDNDGFNDIAVMGCFAGIVSLNLGNGTFGIDENNTRPFWFGDMLSSPISGSDINGDSWIDMVVSGYEWPPEWQIPYYSVILNNESYFPTWLNFGDFNDTLPTGHISATELVDINKDGRQDIIHCGEGVYITFNQDSVLAVEEINSKPNNFYLSQNYPNPFNAITMITYSVKEKDDIQLIVFDMLGSEVAKLVSEEKPPGKYSIKFDANNLPSGIYFYRLTSGKYSATKKLILLK